MPLLQLRNITLRYSAAPLLDGADLQIDAGERICLVGRNGAGKTTLMRVMTGEETPQEGEISRPASLVISRLPQEVPAGLIGTVHEVVQAGLRRGRHRGGLAGRCAHGGVDGGDEAARRALSSPRFPAG